MKSSRRLLPVVAALGLATAGAQADVDILHYSFPDSWNGTGTSVLDLSSAGNNAVKTGTASVSATIPPLGTGSSFYVHHTTTSGQGGMQTSATKLLSNTVLTQAGIGGFQYTTTFMWDGTDLTSYGHVEKIVDYAGTESLQLTTAAGGTAALQMIFGGDGGAAPSLTYSIAANTWYSVAMTFNTGGAALNGDGTLTGLASLFVNGSLVAQATETKGNATDPANFDGDNLNRPIGIGELALGGSPPSSSLVGFNGYIYDASVSLISVPEPSTASLALLGIGGLIAARRRKKA